MRTLHVSALFVSGALLSLACGSTPPASPAAPKPAATQEKPAAAPVDPRYALLPKPSAPALWAPPAPEHFTLANGIRITYLKQGPTPLVSLQLVIPRGSATDPAGKAGVTYLLADMLDEGAGKRNALALNDELGLMATDYGASAGIDYVRLGMNMLAENFETSLTLLSDIVRRPRLPQDEFERRKAHFIAEAISSEAEPGRSLDTGLHRVLFGDGYAGDAPDGDRKTLATITHADLKTQYKALIAPEGVEIVIVGGIDQARVKAALEKAFGDWTGKASTKNRAVAAAPTKPPIYVIHYAGAAQSALSVAQRAGNALDPDYFQDLVYNWQIGDAFTSRINLNLREAKGYTYGAGSDFRRYREAGYFNIATSVRTDATRPSIDEIFREVGEVCQKRPLTETERNDAVNGLLLGYPAQFERIDGVALRFATVPIYARPIDFWQTWPTKVAAVTTANVNVAGRKRCDPNEYAIVIAGDKDAIQSSLSGLGREVVELDRQGHPVAKKD
jgi:zinc protease